MRGREGGLSRERVDVVCLLSFRPELYLELQTGSSAPERPDDPASLIQEPGRAHQHTAADPKELIARALIQAGARARGFFWKETREHAPEPVHVNVDTDN